MKKLIGSLVLVLGLCILGAGTMGCGKKEASADDKYTLEAASGTVKQGAEEGVKVTIKRGKNFKDAVTIKGVPPDGQGLTVEDATIAKDSNEGTLKVKAKDDAKTGDHKIALSGPKDAKGEATVKVNPK